MGGDGAGGGAGDSGTVGVGAGIGGDTDTSSTAGNVTGVGETGGTSSPGDLSPEEQALVDALLTPPPTTVAAPATTPVSAYAGIIAPPGTGGQLPLFAAPSRVSGGLLGRRPGFPMMGGRGVAGGNALSTLASAAGGGVR